jgi:hypothetical protein
VAGLPGEIAFDEMAIYRIRKIARKQRLGGEWGVVNPIGGREARGTP